MNTLNKGLITLAVAGALLGASLSVASADDQENVCVQVYGGGVVCGAQAPHQPVNTGIGENLALIGAGLVLASGVSLFLSKKARISSL